MTRRRLRSRRLKSTASHDSETPKLSSESESSPIIPLALPSLRHDILRAAVMMGASGSAALLLSYPLQLSLIPRKEFSEKRFHPLALAVGTGTYFVAGGLLHRVFHSNWTRVASEHGMSAKLPDWNPVEALVGLSMGLGGFFVADRLWWVGKRLVYETKRMLFENREMNDLYGERISRGDEDAEGGGSFFDDAEVEKGLAVGDKVRIGVIFGGGIIGAILGMKLVRWWSREGFL